MPIITPLDFEEEIRRFRGQALTLPPITQAHCHGNSYTTKSNFHEALRLPDISTAAKRRRLARRKAKKKDKKAKDSSEVRKVKKKIAPPIRRMPGEITKSFSVISSASGSKYTLIQRQSSSGSLDDSDPQETDL